MQQVDQFIFPGLGGATSGVEAHTAAFTVRTLILITVTQNTWVRIGQSAVAAAQTALLVTPSTPVKTMAAPGDRVSWIQDSTAGQISIVQIAG